MMRHFVLMLAAYFCIWGLGYVAGTQYEEEPKGIRSIHVSPKERVAPREKVRCEFEKPLKHVTLINHWYDTHEEMYAAYLFLAEPEDPKEIWGWSYCFWQPQDDAAQCDVYAVKPTFVHNDKYMETIGHETFHAACGSYHE